MHGAEQYVTGARVGRGEQGVAPGKAFSLVLMFGHMVGNMKHARLIYGVMMLLFLSMIGWAITWDTLHPNHALTGQQAGVYPLDTPQPDGTVKHQWMVTNAGGPPDLTDRDPLKKGSDRPVPGVLVGLPVDQELGNLEGKELRFGTSAGSTFSAVTTAVTCGSVNCMHDSLNPLAGLTPLTGMWLNCVFGGKGVGLVNMLVYLIVGVFLAGLMVGRTPEYLGKKVEAREMKLAMLALLIHPILTLGPTGLFAALDWGTKATNNPGAHGFSEILYEFTSASANNGSGFEGLGDTWGFNDPKANNSPPRAVQPVLGHRHGSRDALRSLHPDHRPDGPRRRPGEEEADPVHVRDDANRYADVWVRPPGHDHPGRRATVPPRCGTRPGRRAPGTDALRGVSFAREAQGLQPLGLR